MATIQKRLGENGDVTWRVLIRRRGHETVSRTFKRKVDASLFAAQAETTIGKGGVIDTESERTTLAEALKRYAKEITPAKKSADRETDRILAWARHPLAKKFLARLRGADFAEYRDARRAEGMADGTIRLELALISHLFKVASSDWGMEGLRNPIKSMRLPKGSTARDRRLVGTEETRLLPELAKIGPYVRPLVEFAIETAARQGELLALKWRDVDLPGRSAKFVETKTGGSRTIPLSTRAIAVLKSLPASLDRESSVFPVRQDVLIRGFARACKAAEITGLRFHDLRHEGVSRLFEKGLNVMEVKSISGHKTMQMLARYTHPRAADIAAKLG